jgi:DNA-directed RNA polymerase subunit RPC12/RpoP
MSTRGRGSKAHTHKYHYIPFSYTKVWACALGDCTHFMPAHMNAMMPGRKSLCWECGNEFHLDEESMKNSEPICPECANAAVVNRLLTEKRL